jgi:hypothetical protein
MATQIELDHFWEKWKYDERLHERCPLVNPLCPDDLCILRKGHPGASQNCHWLGTNPDIIKLNNIMYMADDDDMTDMRLIYAGATMQELLFPED